MDGWSERFGRGLAKVVFVIYYPWHLISLHTSRGLIKVVACLNHTKRCKRFCLFISGRMIIVAKWLLPGSLG